MHALADCYDSAASTALRFALPKVLVVEDDPVFRTLFAAIVRRVRPDAKISSVASCEDAFRALESKNVDLVIADHLLAGPRTGMDLWRRCRKEHPEIPFLLTSGEIFPAANEGASAIGAAPPFFLPKPFAQEHCRRLLRTLLGHD